MAIAWLNEALESGAQGERLRWLPKVTAGLPRLVTHPRVFGEPTPSEATHAFLGALLQAERMGQLTLTPKRQTESVCRCRHHLARGLQPSTRQP